MKNKVTYNGDSYKFAFLAALFLIGAIAIYGWFVVPHQNYLKAAQDYGSAIDTLSKKKQVISNNLKTKRIEYDKLHENLSFTREKLFDLPGEREFFSNIENLCKKTGCKMLSLTFSQSAMTDSKTGKELTENKLVASSSANLAFAGRYGSIVAMMNKLQDSSKLVRLSSININMDSEKPGYLNCELIITIYVINEKREYQND